MIYRFHHIHLICKELEPMISFFTDVLNAKLVARQKFGTADGASIDLQGTTINLRVSREDEKMVGDASESRYGFDHIGCGPHRFNPEGVLIFHTSPKYSKFEDCFF